MSTPEERRERGRAWMQRVYGWELDQVEGDFLELTVDHLFGEVWNREGLSIRERRLLLVGILVGLGEHDVADLQLGTALGLGELDETELRDIVRLVAHYAGWARGAKLNTLVEELLAQHRRRAEAAE